MQAQVFLKKNQNINNMKKYSIICALLMVIGVSFSSCRASAKVSTKDHEVEAGTHVK
jgi:hypothetical protein